MGWKVTISNGASLDEHAIRELWSFQLSILRLKPHVSPEKDFEEFASLCRQGQRILRIWGEHGQLCGSIVPLLYDGSFQGQPYRLLVPEFFFLTPEVRGRTVAIRAWARCLFPLLVPKRGVRLFVGGIGYPDGALTLDRFMGPVWLYGDSSAPPLASHVLDWIVEHMADKDWDPHSQQVHLTTVPPSPTELWLARNQRNALYRRYVERCPRWQEGWALPQVTEFSASKLASSISQRFLRRWWKHRLP
jgi:hypothetical protein